MQCILAPYVFECILNELGTLYGNTHYVKILRVDQQINHNALHLLKLR